MQAEITLQALLQCGAIIVGLWGFIKILMQIIESITERHDREQAWDKAVKDIEVDRDALKKEFNDRLDEQDGKFQQLLSMLCMCLRSQDAILDALVKDNIGNGEIKEMHKELKVFIMDQVEK